MKKRLIKKIAKNYLDGRDISKYVLSINEYWLGDGHSCVSEIVVGERLTRAIFDEAMRRGWDGVHWDSPFRIFNDSDWFEWGYASFLRISRKRYPAERFDCLQKNISDN